MNYLSKKGGKRKGKGKRKEEGKDHVRTTVASSSFLLRKGGEEK